jgi:EmrB/QacA subfamily drug resistance transporter
MVVLDVSVVFVALPSMRTSLDLGPQGQQWVVNAYTLTFAGFLLLGGRAGDYFGRKRIFIIGLSIFVLSSLAGGLAQDGWQLVTARTVQGLGSALLAPSTLSLLTTTYTEPRARARALGIWAAMGATGGAFGAVVGGILTDLLSWRWVLFINVPIGAVLIAGAVVALPALRGVSTGWRNLDLPGAFAVTSGLALVIYAIVGTDSRPWASTDTVLPLLGGVVLLAIFLVIEARTPSPLVPMRIFRLRALSAANATTLLVGSVMFGGFFFVALYLQQVLHHSPLKGGLEAVPGGLSIMLATFIATKVIRRVGPRVLISGGLVLSAAGQVWLAQAPTTDHYWSSVFPALVLTTLGIGFTLMPTTVAATAGVPPHEAGLAAGLINTSRQIGGAIGLAALATIAANRTASALAEHATVPHALNLGYNRAFLVDAGIALAGALIALTLPKVKRAQPVVGPVSPAATAAEVPANTVPANTVPANTVPANTVPANTGPANTGPANTVPVER